MIEIWAEMVRYVVIALPAMLIVLLGVPAWRELRKLKREQASRQDVV